MVFAAYQKMHGRSLRIVGFVLLSWVAMIPAHLFAQEQTTTIYYPGSVSDQRSHYTTELLKLALGKSNTHYEVLPSEIVSPKARNFTLLERNKGIDVVWSMTNKPREDRFLPIRIPIFKGLSGWRVSLVHEENKNLLVDTFTLDDLRKFSIGQMHAWTDAKILDHNKLKVDSGPSYESMFRMLSVKRFDLFPRSAIEALQEIKIYSDIGITVDPHVAIHYPTAIYFFVSKRDVALRKDIESGLEAMITSGEFDRMFSEYFEDIIYEAKLQHRHIIKLENPLLPALTPLSRSELWYTP